MKVFFSLLIFWIGLWFLVLCVSSRSTPALAEYQANPKDGEVTFSQTPTSNYHSMRPISASWYGLYFQNKLMANGQRFDLTRISAAHRYLPLGTLLLLQNPRNGKEIVVEVTDRGPYVKGRDIDLSYAAAKALGFGWEGLAILQYRELYRPR
ncbi:MAG: septal ring lytic transglycosylase RlpA family protein [Candidatus Paceibacterota bacterium]